MYLCVYLSVYLFIDLSIYFCVCLLICFVDLYIYVFSCLCVDVFIDLCVYVCVFLFVYLVVCLFVCLFVGLRVCLSQVWLSCPQQGVLCLLACELVAPLLSCHSQSCATSRVEATQAGLPPTWASWPPWSGTKSW